MNERRNVLRHEEFSQPSGRSVPKAGRKTGDKKFRRTGAAPSPSERLRHDGDVNPETDKKTAKEEKKLNKSKLRAEKTEVKLDAARGKLSRQKPPGKPGVIRQSGQSAGRSALTYAHKKIFQVEDENSAVKAAHRAELAGEGLVRGGIRFVKRRIRTAPARKVRKWERKNIRAAANHRFRTLAREYPELSKNAVSRVYQKQKIRRQYLKQARDAARNAAGTAGKTFAEKTVRAVWGFVKRHPAAMMLLGFAFMLMTILNSCMGNALVIGNGLGGAAGGSSYLAEDYDINRADILYTEWETELTIKAKNAEDEYPGFDEYQFDIDGTGHSAHALMAFLTAKYEDFTAAEVEPVLREIFGRQYTLTFTEVIEVRKRIEVVELPDPETGILVETEVEVEYDWRILKTVLTAKSFEEVVESMFDTPGQQERYMLYSLIKGNRQYAGSPFAFDWLPYISSPYGYRVHPFSGAKSFHSGADIALPEGTEILAGNDGTVLNAGNNGDYGLSVLIDYGDGVTVRYAHCSGVLVSAGQGVSRGQTVALVGNTGLSTGAHLHFEVMKDGETLNPLYFAVIPHGG